MSVDPVDEGTPLTALSEAAEEGDIKSHESSEIILTSRRELYVNFANFR